MGQKTNNRILWHGNGLNAEGKAVAPVKAVAGGDGTDGLNEGELYICNSDSDPALFILTDAGNVVRIDGNGSDTYTREQINEKLNAKVDVAFFSRMFGLIDEEGGEIQVNDVETLASSIKAKLGFWTEQYLSAKGKNPDAGATPGGGGATTLAALTDVSITTTPKDGQVLAYDITMNKWKPVDMEATAGIDEAQLAQYLTTNNYAKKADITAALTDYALKTTRIKAGTGLTGGGTLAQDVTLSLATVGTAGTYTKVTVDSYGRVTGHGSLAAGDIPALAISKITGLQAALDAKMDAADFEKLFEKVYVSGHGYAIRAKLALYTDSWMSAKGSNPDAGSVSAGLDEEQLAEYLTEHGYATQTWVKQQGYLTECAEIDLSGYATQSWVNSQGFLKSVSVSDVTGLQAALDAKMDASQLSNLYRKRTDNAVTVSKSLSALVAENDSDDAWNVPANTVLMLSNSNNALAFHLGGTMNERAANIQVGHNSSSYATAAGVLYLNRFGGTVVVGNPAENPATLNVSGGLYASGYIQVGSARLRYDSANNALYVQKSDGTQCGFYATGFVSTKGANGDAGSVVAGVTALSELEDVTISSPANGQALVYRNGTWKNEAIETGLTTVSWEDVEGKPTWIGSTKPTYTAAEVGALTQTTADGRYVRQNLGYIGNNADLDDYTGSGLYIVSASSYATIGNFPTESAYGYGTLVSLMFAEGRGVQWYIPDYSHPMAIRQAWTADEWQGWTYLLTHRNYTTYTVTKTGGGASGTWGIGITGNAGSATKLQTARTIALSGAVSGSTTFDGSAGVTVNTAFNAQSLLTSLKTVDGSGCGLDADMLDGYEATDFYRKKVANAVTVSKSLSALVAENGSADAWNAPANSSLFLTNNNNALSFYVGGMQNERTANIQVGHNSPSYATALGTLYLNRLGGNVCIGNPDTTAHRLNVDGGICTDSYIQVGSARLRYDSANNALYVQKSDGTQCGFYATGFVSTKGANGDAGSEVAGVTELSELDDVTISSPVNGQTLVYRNGVWKNEAVETGLDEAALAEYLTTNQYAKTTDIPSLSGYATQTWVNTQLGSYATTSAMNSALGNKADKTITITAGSGLTGGGNLSANRTLSLATVGTAGTYTKVTVDAYGRVTGHSSLSAGDIPVLAISKITGLQDALDAKMDASQLSNLYRKRTDNAVTVSKSLSALVAENDSDDAWNVPANTVLMLSNSNNALAFHLGGTMNERAANIQVGHNSSSYATAAGVLYLNRFGGTVVVGNPAENPATLNVSGGLYASGYIQVGSARLRYDSANNALYVQKSDGTQCGFYATGFVSTKGANGDAGSVVAGVTALSELEDVTISSPANGQALVYRNGTWKNEAIETGLTTVSWEDVEGKPTWIGSTKPTYTAAEVGALTQTTADGRYVRQNLGYIGNNADLDDYTGSGLYIVSASSYATIGNFPTESAYGYGTLVSLMFAEGRGVQWYIPDYSHPMAIRQAWTADEWQGWTYLLTHRNYTTYTVTKTGGGASGTWGIAVTGNAGSATRLQTARSINGTAFDGTGSITTSKWGMARTLTLKGAVTGSVSIDGSGNVSLETTYATGNISALDNRYVNVGGDTMTGALTVDLGSGTKLVLGNGIQIWATSGGWARGIVAYDASGDSALANGSICGAYGSGNTLQYTYYGGTYDNPAMVIRGGNVGIGTTSPSHKLHVAGGIYSSDYLQVGSARLRWDSANNALYVQKSDGTACGFYATGFVSAKGANDGGASGDLTGVDSLTFTPGTNNRNLYLNANGMRIITTSLSGWGTGITVYNNANTTKLGDVCGAYGSVNSFAYSYFGGPYNSPGMTILPNKNVGIGTTSPTYKLHVSGTAYATGGFQNGSDIRYKHVLSALPLTVAQVAAAPSFLFRWTDGTADGVQAGTSAQYWQQVMPQVVTESAGRLSMQYDKAALAAAIATARAVETLDQRVTRLEKENARLRRRLRQHKINV